MSVINKMLRDLDGRAGPAQATATRAGPVALGTVSIAVPEAPHARARRGMGGRLLVLGVAVGLIGVLAAWLAIGRPDAEPPPAVDLAPTVPVVPTVAAAAPARIAAVPTPVSEPASGAPAVAPAPSPTRTPTADAPAVPALSAPERPAIATASAKAARSPSAANAAVAQVTPKPVVESPREAPATVKAPAGAPVGQAVAVAAAPRPAVTVASPAAQSQAAPAPVRWQDAAMETMGQAQRLWSDGSADAATHLLRETLVALERSRAAELSGAGAVVGLALLRELVRMEVAQAKFSAVVASLKQHESLATGQADLWAVRAHAAQRTGQHQDSSQAYLRALQIRPGEPRWMLGAAVSLAAQGQTAAAAEMVERARAIETVSPELLAYLRQLGVPLR